MATVIKNDLSRIRPHHKFAAFRCPDRRLGFSAAFRCQKSNVCGASPRLFIPGLALRYPGSQLTLT